MSDRTTSIRHLIVETRTGTDVDTLTEQLVTRALAHESRRRPQPRQSRAHDNDAHTRRTR